MVVTLSCQGDWREGYSGNWHPILPIEVFSERITMWVSDVRGEILLQVCEAPSDRQDKEDYAPSNPLELLCFWMLAL